MIFQHGWAYDTVTPVSRDGIALMGEVSKIVPLAAKRFPAVTNGRSTRATVAFAAGEGSVTVTGYAAKRPRVRAERGSAGQVDYDEATHLFHVDVHPAKGGHEAELVIR